MPLVQVIYTSVCANGFNLTGFFCGEVRETFLVKLVCLVCSRKQCDKTKIKASGVLFIYLLEQALLFFPNCYLMQFSGNGSLF